MESVETPLKINYTVLAHVAKVDEAFARDHVSGTGPDAIFTKRSLGWYVIFVGSTEAIYFGESRPQLNPGDKVKVTFERID